MGDRKTLVLVDGHALAFRAFFALRDTGMAVKTTGEPTFAVQGFFQILLNLLRDQAPEYVAVAFDVGRTFRDDLYAEYKAGRSETPADFHPQLERIQQIIQALNIPIFTAPGYEADDVIGTLCRQAQQQKVNTLIITGDTDTLQLVNEYTHVLLANPYGRTSVKLYTEQEVIERYGGLRPDQLADLRGLKGDTSDNIPGVSGIGEKGAINLLLEWQSVAGIYENLELVPNRYRKKLEDQQETALFSKHLATIVTDVPITLELEATVVTDYDRQEVLDLFQELEFRKLVDKLPTSASGIDVVDIPGRGDQDPGLQMSMFSTPAAATAETAETQFVSGYGIVSTPAQLEDLIAALGTASLIAFDTETTTTHLYGPTAAAVAGISLAVAAGTAWYIPIGHHAGQQLEQATVVQALKPLFDDPQKQFVAHNAKFDLEALALIGIDSAQVQFDTMIIASLLGQKPGLKDLAFNCFQIQMTPIEDLIGKGKNQITMAQVPIATAAAYAAADADMTLRLMHHLAPQLAAEPRLQQVYEKIEQPLIPVVMRMEQHGIALDAEQLAQLQRDMGATLQTIESTLAQYTTTPINVQSRYDLNDLLFSTLNLPAAGLKRLSGTTRTGGPVYSLTADILEGLQEHDTSGVVELILRHRRLSKLKSTYVDTLQTLTNPHTGRVHTQFRQMGTETGRMSSDTPNLQNIPVRSEEGREIRRAFIAAAGYHLLAADYSQIELRILAHITQDATLIDVFQTGKDVHAATAARLFNIPMEQVTKNQRRIAKTTVFGIIYGISSFGLAARTDLSRSEAQQMIEALFAQYPGIKQYIDGTIRTVERQGYVETLFGRRRYFHELRDGTASGPRRQAAEREAINAGIQGTAADLIKIAMIQLDQALRTQYPTTRMLLQVHDELVLEVPHSDIQDVAALVCSIMENVYPALRVPLEVHIEQGPSWDELAPIHIE